jgi:hypothetical protein
MRIAIVAIALATAGFAQTVNDARQTADTQSRRTTKTRRSAGGEIGSGAVSAAGGVAKGAGSLAKGTAKGALDLATLHPLDAGVSVAGGAASAGKDVAVGAVKGAGKITLGVGKALKKLF